MKKVFSLLAVVLALAACNKDSQGPNSDKPAQGIPFQSTLLSSSASKALSESGSSISSTWAVNEEVALVYSIGSTAYNTTARISSVDAQGNATLTGTLAATPTEETPVTLIYPASAADGTSGQVKDNLLYSQDGTLEYISEYLDVRTSSGVLMVNGTTATLKNSVSMEMQFSIWQLTLEDGNAQDINATSLLLKNGSTLLASATNTASSQFYLAVPATTGANLSVIALTSTKAYSFSQSGVSLAARKYYRSTVTLAPDMTYTPMTLEAVTSGDFHISAAPAGMQYSKNGGAKQSINTAGEWISMEIGDVVQFYGNGTSISSYSGTSIKKGYNDTFRCIVYGNIMSLLDEDGFATCTSLSTAYTFNYLFDSNTTLTDASGLLLPATTLTEGCYVLMFMGCSNLVTAPSLPATTLSDGCYAGMFVGCSSLTEAWVKADYDDATCYEMFSGCSTTGTLHTAAGNTHWSAGTNLPASWTIETDY